MQDGFEVMVQAARSFFAELGQNNTKAWFDAHKARYTDDIKAPAEFFASLAAEDLSRLSSGPVKAKVFRIYRDVRFSKDKTPYKTHLHMMWSPVDATPLTPRWFFGVGQDYATVGMAVTGLNAEGITAFRRLIDRDGVLVSAALEQAGQTVGAGISTWGPEPLKRVPKPYEPDHPYAGLLKRKGLVVSCELAEDWEERGLLRSVLERARALEPLYRCFAQG